MSTKYLTSLALMTFFVFSNVCFAQKELPLVVKTDAPTAIIQPTMWGIFFEDINFAADGGIYAELVKNRSFEFSMPLMGWKEMKQENTSNNVLILNNSASNTINPRFARITVDAAQGAYGLCNEGFRGMGVKKDMTYHFSVMASKPQDSNVKLKIELVDSKGNIIGKASVNPNGPAWEKYTVSLTSGTTDAKAKLNIWFEGNGSLDVDMISLFPDDTWKHRPNGLRSDLVQLLADMKPGFIRFPGGCIVEGRDLASRYQWKKTIGNIEDRHVIVNRWNTEFAHRLTPDYFQSFGLGFFEYFQLAEDIGAEPLPVLSCGMACQFNTAEVVPLDKLDPYIQDALDLIEFANGPVSSSWGAIRAAMGHPEPFNMKMIGIGNEQWGPQYIERYKKFVMAIKDKYPSINIVTGTGPFPDGKEFDFAAKELKKLDARIVDEHYYRNPDWFLQNATRYDHYDRNSFKIFAGEYAAQSVAIASPENKNNWECALSEAAFMTGLERNADVVNLSSYAPLFAHTEGWQWTPDLIWFDNLHSFGSANYYVQKLYSNNKGTQVLSMLSNNLPLTGQNKLYGTAAYDEHTGELILKLVNASDKPQLIRINQDGKKKLDKTGRLIVLKSALKDDVNSLENPLKVSPQEKIIAVPSKKIDLSLDPYSLTIFRVKLL